VTSLAVECADADASAGAKPNTSAFETAANRLKPNTRQSMSIGIGMKGWVSARAPAVTGAATTAAAVARSALSIRCL
jgi:hypothetical protein